MGYKILHFVYAGIPISTGYAVRTHSIAKAQKKKGLSPVITVSLEYLIENYLKNLNLSTKDIYEGISYYSAIEELRNDTSFKLSYKLITKDNRITNHLRRRFYLLQHKKILYKYYKFMLSEFGMIDLIHAHVPSIVFNEASAFNNFLKKKILYEIRGFWNLSMENHSQNILEVINDEICSCQKADKCIAICKGIADILVKGGISNKKIEIVPNGVNPDEFSESTKDKSLLRSMKLDNKIIYGYFTSVRWFEGIQIIIKAWPKILKEIPNAVFLLIGGGNYLETIRTMVKEYKIEDSFLMLGRVEREKITAYYSLLDVFVVPRIDVPVSHIVTPLKPLEAMVLGKPIIVSDVKALKEMVINGETGLYFKADDPDDLARICIQLAKDDTLRSNLGNTAREWVLKNRTWDKIAEQYSEIYDSVLK